MSELAEFLFSELGIKWDETSLAWVDRREGEWSSRLVITELAALIKKSRAENTRLKTLAGATEVVEGLGMIHHTAGYCNDGSRKTNGVPPENLALHIQYNLRMRPGRAFFVDGICVHNGYLASERCDEIEKELAGVVAVKDTAPYQ